MHIDYKKILIMSTFLVICGIILPSFCFGENVDMPSDLEEDKSFIITIIERLPQEMKNIWSDEIIPIWRKVWQKIKDIVLKIWPTLKSWFYSILDWLADIWYENFKPWIINCLDEIKYFINTKLEHQNL